MTTLTEKYNKANQILIDRRQASNAKIKKNYVDYISRYKWHEFATLTFKQLQRNPVRLKDMADHWLMKRHFRQAESEGTAIRVTKEKRDAYDRPLPSVTRYKGTFANRWGKGRGRPVYVMAIEPHKTRRGLHAHLLIHYTSFDKPLSRIEGTKLWKDELGFGFIRTDQVKSQEAVSKYISKYVLKGNREESDQDCHIEFSDSFSAPGFIT